MKFQLEGKAIFLKLLEHCFNLCEQGKLTEMNSNSLPNVAQLNQVEYPVRLCAVTFKRELNIQFNDKAY